MEKTGQFQGIKKFFYDLYDKIYEQRVLLFSCLMIISFVVYLINDDFVANDVYEYPSDKVCYVTEEVALEREFVPANQNVHTIMLSVAEPEVWNETYNTYIEIYNQDSLLFKKCLNNGSAYADTYKDGVLSITLDEGLKHVEGSTLTLKIKSDVVEEHNAMGFWMDKSGEVWIRPAYQIMSKNMARIFFSGIIIALSVVFCMILKNGLLKADRPERMFLYCSIILGICYMVIMPMFRVPDSVNHYVRAYGIVQGNLLTPKGGQIEIPKNLVPYAWYSYNPYILFKHFGVEINTLEMIWHDNANMALYSPISYVFQVIGLTIANIVSNNTHVLVLTGCATNFIGCTVLIYYAIKKMPYGKLLLVFISLLPMALQERASLSVDAITYAAIVAFLALCLSARYERKMLTKQDLKVLFILILLVASCKVVYFVVAFLFLIIPRECFGTLRKEIICKLAGFFETICFSVGWLWIAKSYLDFTRGGGETREKIVFILCKPFQYMQMLLKVLWEDGGTHFKFMLGERLGSMDIPINSMLVLIIAFLLVRLYYIEKEKVVCQKRTGKDLLLQFFLIAICLGTFLLIATSLYIQWTSAEMSNNAIEGIQGRYFLPILPLFCYSFWAVKEKEIKSDASEKTEDMSVFWLLVINLLILVQVCVYTMVQN